MLNPELDLNADEYKKISTVNLSLKINVGSILPKNEEGKRPEEIFKAQGITPAEAEVFRHFPADGLNKLVLQNESQGILPAGKPFDPFTAYPGTGKSFYIGSGEVSIQ